MIYTVTFNPAIDYVVQADDFCPGGINRLNSEKIFFGGKGSTFQPFSVSWEFHLKRLDLLPDSRVMRSKMDCVKWVWRLILFI